MARKRYCLVLTYGESAIHARVVQPFPPREDFSVLFGTSRASRKVAELERDPRVTLVYEDDARIACVTLEGRAWMQRDDPPRARRFMASWHAFWPRGPRDDDFVNVRFEADAIEVWDGLRGITPEPFGLVSARLEQRDGVWVEVGR
jgi:general stress protein 26